ncbi:glycosyltransferase [Thiohalocapsa marina]
MVKLLVDATALSPVAKGVGRFVSEVVTRLDDLLPQSWSIQLVCFRGACNVSSDSERSSILQIPPQSDLQLGLWTMPRLLRECRPDLFLRFGDTVGKRYSTQTLTVCHDINEFIFAVQGTRRGWARALVDAFKEYFRVKGLQNSEFVFCNSCFTRNESIDRYGLSEARTSITYCGVDEVFYTGNRHQAVQHVLQQYNCRDYVLTFACGDPRENYKILPSVIFEARRSGFPACFAIAGISPGGRYVTDLIAELTAHGLYAEDDYVLIPFIRSDERERLRDLYVAADYYLELSLHEGFGMQLAEAMACGVTCLAPDHSALGEVGGGFTITIDPRDPRAIADILASSYRSQLHLRDHFRQIEFTKKFSWDRSSREIAYRLMQMQRSGKDS